MRLTPARVRPTSSVGPRRVAASAELSGVLQRFLRWAELPGQRLIFAAVELGKPHWPRGNGAREAFERARAEQVADSHGRLASLPEVRSGPRIALGWSEVPMRLSRT